MFSARRLAERGERRRVVEEVRRRDRSCRATCVMEVACGGPLDVHEIIPRSAWALGYLDADNCALVCRRHHDWIDLHPDEAHEIGLHRESWERTA